MKVLSNLFKNDTIINVNAIAVKNSNGVAITLDEYLNNRDIYSTDEQIVGTWVDGKPIYRKVIDTTTPSSTNVESVVASLTDEKSLISLNAFVYQTATQVLVPVPYYFGTSNYGMIFF